LERSAKVLGLKSEQKSIDKILESPGQVADSNIQKILQKDFKKARRGLKKSLHAQKQNQHVMDLVRFKLSKMTPAEKKKFETKLQSQVKKIQKKKEQAGIQTALHPPKHKPTPLVKGPQGSIQKAAAIIAASKPGKDIKKFLSKPPSLKKMEKLQTLKDSEFSKPFISKKMKAQAKQVSAIINKKSAALKKKSAAKAKVLQKKIVKKNLLLEAITDVKIRSGEKILTRQLANRKFAVKQKQKIVKKADRKIAKEKLV
jgi:hypothetical protein